MAILLNGSLTHFPLAELLPVLGRRTGTLVIDAQGNKAQFLVRNGLLIRAESAASTEPLDVALEIATWPGAIFSFVDAIDLPAATTELTLPVDQFLEQLRLRSNPFSNEATFRVVDDAALQDSLALSPAELKLLIRIGMRRTFSQLVEGRDQMEVVTALKRFLEVGLILMHEQPAAPKPALTPRPEVSLIASLTEEGSSGAAWVLMADEETIGREPVNSIPISDGSISGRHAAIRRGDNGFILEDLGSRNGSFVNGERLTGPQPLADNDIIRLGKVVFTFNLATQVDPVDPTAH